MNHVLESERGEGYSSIEGAAGAIAQHNWNSQVGDNGAVCFPKMPCHGHKLNLCKWLVSDSPLCSNFKDDFGLPRTNHFGGTSKGCALLIQQWSPCCAIIISLHVSLYHTAPVSDIFYMFKSLKKSWMNEDLTKTAKVLQGSLLPVVSNDIH